MSNFTSCVLKLIIIILMNLLAFMIYNCNFNELQYMKQRYMEIKAIQKQQNIKDHQFIIEEYFDRRKEWKTSVLGSILFQNETDYTSSKKYQYLILIWRHWHLMKNRHDYYFGEKPHNPLAECSVNNCKFTGKDEWFDAADAVVINLQRGLLPNVTKRIPYQRWIFLTDEAPTTDVYFYETPTTSKLTNIFNWSMTYRTDSDIPVPYGRTVPLSNPVFLDPSYQNLADLVPNWEIKKRDVLITVLMTYCPGPLRMKYLKELKKYMKLDIYGRCPDKDLVNICPGNYKSNCSKIGEYLFYFVLENSMCRQYMTEKLFFNAYYKGAIPIIKGPPLQDCEALLPPKSFIHVDDFLTPSDMADEIISISKDDKKLLSYHHWRNHFKVVNEHGYYATKSVHLCRLCEAMNYNDQSYKVYTKNDIRSFLDEDLLCNNVVRRYQNRTKKKQTTKSLKKKL